MCQRRRNRVRISSSESPLPHPPGSRSAAFAASPIAAASRRPSLPRRLPESRHPRHPADRRPPARHTRAPHAGRKGVRLACDLRLSAFDGPLSTRPMRHASLFQLPGASAVISAQQATLLACERSTSSSAVFRYQRRLRRAADCRRLYDPTRVLGPADVVLRCVQCRCEPRVAHVLGAGEEIGEPSREPRREILIEEQFQAAGIDSKRRSRSAANPSKWGRPSR
jgi:hypothetical protein